MSALSTKQTSTPRAEKMKKRIGIKKDTVPLHVEVDAILHRKFKIKTIERGMSMTEVIEHAMLDFINKS